MSTILAWMRWSRDLEAVVDRAGVGTVRALRRMDARRPIAITYAARSSGASVAPRSCATVGRVLATGRHPGDTGLSGHAGDGLVAIHRDVRAGPAGRRADAHSGRLFAEYQCGPARSLKRTVAMSKAWRATTSTSLLLDSDDPHAGPAQQEQPPVPLASGRGSRRAHPGRPLVAHRGRRHAIARSTPRLSQAFDHSSKVNPPR